MRRIFRAGVLPCLFLAALTSLEAQKVTANVPTGQAPSSIAVNPVTGKIYVVNAIDGTVTVIDGKTNTTVTVSGIVTPAGIAVNPASNKIYVSSAEGAAVTVIDGLTNSTSSVNVGNGPSGIAVNPVTNRIYVMNQVDSTVTVINGTNNATSTVTLTGVPYGLAVNPVTNKIYVALASTNNVAVIDGATNTASTVPAGMFPNFVAVNQATNKVYVANSADNTVTVIDGNTGSTATVSVGTGPVQLAVNPVTNKIYVANNGSNNISVIDGATNSVATVTVGLQPGGIVVNPLTNRIFALNAGDATLTELNGATNGLIALLDLDAHPFALAVDPVTNRAYISIPLDPNTGLGNEVTVIDGAENPGGSVSATFGSPGASAVNPATNKIYVANPGYNPLVPGAGAVLVVDGATDTGTNVVTGSQPVSVAVNALTNKIYVANSGGGSVTVVDGTNNSTVTIGAGLQPQFAAANPVTNKIYVANFQSNNVTVIDGSNNTTTTVAVGTGPSLIAINQATNKIYVVNVTSNNVSVIDGATNSVATVNAGTSPAAIDLNPITNTVYVVNSGTSDMTVIAGATNATTTVTLGNSCNSVAVNPASNKIYVGCAAGAVLGVDGVTNTLTSITSVPVGMPAPTSLAVDPATNKVFFSGQMDTYLTVIDGLSNAASTSILGQAVSAISVNPVTGKVYFSEPAGGTFVLTEQPVQPVPLTTSISPLSGNTTTSTSPSFFLSGTSTFSPAVPPGQNVFFQVDTLQGAWQVSSTVSGNTYSGMVSPALQIGGHILYAYMGDSQLADASEPGSDVIGNITAYYFAVLPPVVPQPQPQTISFGPLSNQTFGVAPFTITATATSGLTVAFASNTLGVCTVSATTVTILAAGPCSITASQAGNAAFLPATPVTQSFTVNQAPQTITFGALSNQVFGTAPFTISATASSGLVVSLASNTTGICTLSGSTVTLVSVGLCSITASQAGNSNYLAATLVTRTFNVTQGPQTINFAPLGNRGLAMSPFSISATATSGLAVSFASNSITVCTVAGTTVTLVNIGTCSITASQAGNANYLAASPVTQTFQVSPSALPQTITFPPISNQTYGVAPFTITATASSGLPVLLISESLFCTVAGNTVTIVGAGLCSIVALQPGNNVYAGATPVSQNFTINQAPQTITFGPLPDRLLPATPFTVSATASSGLLVSFSSQTPLICTLAGTTVTLLLPGTCSIMASQAGNSNIAAAQSVTQSFTVIGPLQIRNTFLPDGLAGTLYQFNIMVTGGTSPYVYSASGLPGGLSVNSSTGLVSGFLAAGASGAYPVQLSVQDSGHRTASLTLTLNVGQALHILTTVLPNATVGNGFSQFIAVAGGIAPFTFNVSPGSQLPTGITLSTGGLLSGFPSIAGTYTFSITVVDSVGVTDSATYSLLITPRLTIATPSPLDNGITGRSYSVTFSVTGGLPPYTFVLDTPPPGLALNPGGVLSGTAAGTGTFGFNLRVTDSAGSAAAKAFQVTFAVPAALSVSPLSLNFSGVAGGDFPPLQELSITSDGAPLRYTAQAISGDGSSPAPAWLTVRVPSGVTPDHVMVSVDSSQLTAASNSADAARLAAGTYSARVRISATGNSPQAPIDVPVALSLTSAPPAPDVTQPLLRFSTFVNDPAPQTQDVVVRNAGGGGPLSFTATVVGGSPWISVNPQSGQVQPNAPVPVAITVNTAGLSAGSHRDVVRIVAGGKTTDIPLDFFLAGGGPILGVNVTGVRFPIVQGSSSSAARPVNILNQGTPGSTLNWTAEILSGADWLTFPQGSSGSALPGLPGVLMLLPSPNVAAFPAGSRYALVKISASGALDSPQYVIAVLDIAPQTSNPVPDLSDGLLFFTVPAGSPAAQKSSVQVNTSSSSPVSFQAGASTDQGNWLSVSPLNGTATVASPGMVAVTIDPTGLTSNVIYKGRVRISIKGIVRTKDVTLIVIPASSAPLLREGAVREAAACSANALAITQASLSDSFSAPAGWPATIVLQINDNCGGKVNNASVVASFSNGDPPLTVQSDFQTATYSTTWQPRGTANPMTITVRATAQGFPQATSQLAGAVTPNTAPVLAPGGILHNLNPLVGSALAPGTVAQVYGTGLASGTSAPSNVPLPSSFNGTNMLVGGMGAPLYFLSTGQLVVQIPAELAANQQYSAVVSANGALTLPDKLSVVALAPGVAAFPDGTLIAQRPNGALVSTAAPAKPGESLVMYLAGLGATNPAVASGNAAPSNALAPAVVQPTVTVDGQNASIQFAGLTPGGVGLYQINFQVPASAKTGNLKVVVMQGDGVANPTTLPVSP